MKDFIPLILQKFRKLSFNERLKSSETGKKALKKIHKDFHPSKKWHLGNSSPSTNSKKQVLRGAGVLFSKHFQEKYYEWRKRQ